MLIRFFPATRPRLMVRIQSGLFAVILLAVGLGLAPAGMAANSLPYYVDPSGNPTWTDNPTNLAGEVRDFRLALQSSCNHCDASNNAPAIVAQLDTGTCGPQCRSGLHELRRSRPLQQQSLNWLLLSSAGKAEAFSQQALPDWQLISAKMEELADHSGRRHIEAMIERHRMNGSSSLQSAPGRDHLARHSLPVVLLDSNGWIRGVYDAAQPGEVGRLVRDLARVE